MLALTISSAFAASAAAWAADSILKEMAERAVEISLVVAVLISFSRLYIGIHYPTDVIAAALIGSAIGFLVCLVGNLIIDKWKEKHSKKEVQ